MSHKINIIDIAQSLPERIALFIGTASFEARCLSILTSLVDSADAFMFFKNVEAGEIAEENLQKMRALTILKNRVFEIDLDRPTITADAFQKCLSMIDSAADGLIFVDITTFTHEQLLIFLRVVTQTKHGRRFIFGYTGAEQYSTNTNADGVWLSRGVSQVRSILGFPGEFLPSKKLHLIVLVGFEHDRAKAVIEKFEPSSLTLGIGDVSHSVSKAHYETNQRFFDEVKSFIDLKTSIYSQVNIFKFSGIDPVAAKSSILAEVKRLPAYNTVICPMNTKISTFGAGLAAVENPALQVCYSRAITYNESGYSTPSAQATIFEMDL
ncbi:hypothetical protein [Duganella hordei]|uniref:hypothetical protein n=1 Tax=Duganella hordei TaxID=2865934 RepID=UPI0030E8DD88